MNLTLRTISSWPVSVPARLLMVGLTVSPLWHDEKELSTQILGFQGTEEYFQELFAASLIERRDNKVKVRVKVRNSRKVELSDTFVVTDRMKDWVVQTCPGLLWDYETEKFVDYYKSAGRQFSDWEAAWRNWMRRAYENYKFRPNHSVLKKSRLSALVDYDDEG